MDEKTLAAKSRRLTHISELLTEKSRILNLAYRGDAERERLEALEVELKVLWLVEPAQPRNRPDIERPHGREHRQETGAASE